MRLLVVEIHGFRGLPDLTLDPRGKNLVIWGPNGSGKSGVIDAIDFVVTGRISRLMGEGTAGISLAKHGPHIDRKPEDAVVSATLLIPGFSDPVKVRRCVVDPDKLECPPEAADALSRVQYMAKQGQLALTRRDILRYITAEAGKRADQIEALLDLSDIDGVRQTFVRVKNKATEEARGAERSVRQARTEVGAVLKGGKFSEPLILETANEHRAILGGTPLLSARAEVVKQGLTPPAPTSKTGLNVDTLRKSIKNLESVMVSAESSTLSTIDARLRELVKEARSDPQMLEATERFELIRLGLRQVDKRTVTCPLCGANWPPGHLRRHLEEEEKRIAALTKLQHQAEEVGRSFSQIVLPVRANLSNLIEIVSQSEIKDNIADELAVLSKWQAQLNRLLGALDHPLDRFLEAVPEPSDKIRLFSPTDLPQVLSQIDSTVGKAAPQQSPQQVAWDALTRLETILSALERRVAEERSAVTTRRRAEVLLEQFEKARDVTLQQLYNRIAQKFIQFYRALHPHEASTFDAQLRPEGASLRFEVDFLGRGTHPPHALHSEGHQDSMGLCLFLALNEELSKGEVALIALDDVMMSVDATHRKEVCRLFADAFPAKQFLITTHDRAWAKQLQQERVVEPTNVIEFAGWTVETGPRVNAQVDLWKRISVDLEREDVPEAAFKLRRGSEEFFESVCDALGASVVYNSRGQWELGDWLPAAMNRYRELLAKALKASRSWGNAEEVKRVEELESIRRQVFERTHVEQWAINPSVHYNDWVNLSRQDFTPVVDAFQDLHGLFLCSTCKGLLEAVPRSDRSEVVKCPCGTVNWNLKAKP